MAAIKTCIESEGITQREVPERFNVARPRISEIHQGKIKLFSADMLFNMLARVVSWNEHGMGSGRTMYIGELSHSSTRGPLRCALCDLTPYVFYPSI